MISLAVAIAALVVSAPTSPQDAFSLNVHDRAVFDVNKAALQALQAKGPLSAEDAETLARYIVADASADAADYGKRWSAVQKALFEARGEVAVMKTGGPYPADWQKTRWLKGRAAATDPDARALFERVFLDQSVLSMGSGLDPVGEEAFQAAFAPDRHAALVANADWLKGVLARIGWFDISRYGEEASQAAWLMVQHADHDPAWQKVVLQTLAPKVKSGDMQPKYYAYLIDRVAVNAGEAQTYGTQGGCVGSGDWQPKRLIAPESLGQRRAEVGLEPIETYRARFTCK